MSNFIDHCASCGASITLDEGDIGHRLACYACGRRYYVCEGGWLAPERGDWDVTEAEPEQTRAAKPDPQDED